MDKREQIKNYFKPFPRWLTIFMVIGFFLIPAGIGVLMILFGLYKIFAWRRKKHNDKQIDIWIEEDLQQMQKQALIKTGLDESELVSDFVMITGLRLANIGELKIGMRKGQDNIIRFNPIGVTMINFTEHQLVTYQCALDLETGNPLSESTDEYFYKDVVSVSTQTESISLDKSMLSLSNTGIVKTALASFVQNGKLQLNTANIFVLTTAGGDSIKVVIDDPTLVKSMGGGIIPTDRADTAIKAVRRMLRDKAIKSS